MMSLGGHSGRQLAIDVDGHRLERSQRECLGGQDVLHLGSPDAHCDCAECTVRRGVAVTAHDRHARLSQTQLRPDDMDDPLFDIAHRVKPNPEFVAIAAKRLHLNAGHRICNRLVDVDRRHVVVFGGQCQIGTVHRTVRQPQTVERLRTGHFVHQVQIDVNQVRFGAVTRYHHVVVPHLFRKRARARGAVG